MTRTPDERRQEHPRFQRRIDDLVRKARSAERARFAAQEALIAQERKGYDDFRAALGQLSLLLDRPDALRTLAGLAQHKQIREAERIVLQYIESSGTLTNKVWDTLATRTPVDRAAVAELEFTGVGEPGY